MSCTVDCRKIIDGFKDKSVDAVMMDLRGNGGGLLNEAVSLSGLFIDKGPIVQVRKSNGVEQLDDEEAGTAWDGPLVVLIDRLSASASEIFAGAIKDYGRGLIIGDSSTYGKGTVQQVVPLNDRFSRPERRHGRAQADDPAVLPGQRRQHADPRRRARHPHPLALRPVRLRRGEDGQRHEVRSRRRPPPRPVQPGSRPLVAQLDARSEKRRAESDKFQKRDAAIKKMIDRKARHAISLNEAKFRAEIVSEEENKDEAKDKKKEPRKRLTDRPVWESNFYNDEVVHIVGRLPDARPGRLRRRPDPVRREELTAGGDRARSHREPGAAEGNLRRPGLFSLDTPGRLATL